MNHFNSSIGVVWIDVNICIALRLYMNAISNEEILFRE